MNTTKPRYTVRKQSSSYTTSETFYVYDLQNKGRVTVHAHTVREAAQADADRLNASEAQHQANLADPEWIAQRDATLAAQAEAEAAQSAAFERIIARQAARRSAQA